MDENNPINQGGVEEQKLQKLGSELGGLEKKDSEVPPQPVQPSQSVQEPASPPPPSPSPAPASPPTGKSKVLLWVGLGFLVLAVIGTGGYYLGSRQTTPTPTPTPYPTVAPTSTPVVPSPTPQPTATVSATPTSTPSVTPTSTPSATITP